MNMNDPIYFDSIASEVFYLAYPLIAAQIVEKTGMRGGNCLDIGCAGGHLGICLVETTDLMVTLMDIKPEAIRIAEDRVRERGLAQRIKAVCGDVHSLPFADESFDLIVSRGSVWFWQDHHKAFAEIYRVLAPGGQTYIGCGFGNAELYEEIRLKMRQRAPGWEEFKGDIMEGQTTAYFSVLLSQLGIKRFDITDDDRGLWIIIKK